MDEAEYSRISMMVDGEIKALDTLADLKQKYAVSSMDEVFYELARGAKGMNSGELKIESYFICQLNQQNG